MHDYLFQNAKKYHITHRRKKLWQRVVRVFGCIVVFCTVYALILPAITMESETVCGLEAHTHNESCYAAAPVSARFSFTCDEDQLSLHVHSADCYDDAGVLRCGLADVVLHTHDRSCYDDGAGWYVLCPRSRRISIRTAVMSNSMPIVKAAIRRRRASCSVRLPRASLTCTQTAAFPLPDPWSVPSLKRRATVILPPAIRKPAR